MKPETEEWAAKAEGDWTVARREMEAEFPVWDVICFLCQQCAEKYLKAYLEERDLAFKKTHDLAVLHDMIADQLSAELQPHKQRLARLGTFGIAARYPGTKADQKAAVEAMQTAKTVRAAVRKRLPLS